MEEKRDRKREEKGEADRADGVKKENGRNGE